MAAASGFFAGNFGLLIFPATIGAHGTGRAVNGSWAIEIEIEPKSQISNRNSCRHGGWIERSEAHRHVGTHGTGLVGLEDSAHPTRPRSAPRNRPRRRRFVGDRTQNHKSQIATVADTVGGSNEVRPTGMSARMGRDW
jgi:hypothetical protein